MIKTYSKTIIFYIFSTIDTVTLIQKSQNIRMQFNVNSFLTNILTSLMLYLLYNKRNCLSQH